MVERWVAGFDGLRGSLGFSVARQTAHEDLLIAFKNIKLLRSVTLVLF